MNFNNESEITKRKFLGSGTFGSVYQYEDYAIKIYHDFIKDGICCAPNPCLDGYKRLKKLLII